MRRRLRALVVLFTGLVAVLLALLPSSAGASAGTPIANPPPVAVPVAVSVAQPTLRVGSRGPAVTALQRRLAALRYDVGVVDGVFGNDTLHAVIAFQKVQRVGIDGVVGPITWARLAKPVVLRPRHTTSAAAVEVNLTLRVVLLTKAGVVTRILDASPGKPSTPTVTGSFSIQRRVNGWHQSPLGMLWRPNYFYRGYAIHGFTSVPTSAASHGCVRVTIASMNRVWSQLYLGERVWVYR